jgi:hypothetical protein
MEVLFVPFVMLSIFLLLAVLAIEFGVDSRTPYPDDWARPTSN